jgi:hypothetical protein
VKYESVVGQDKKRRHNIEESGQRAQSNPRARPEWTYSRGAAKSSRSSMNKMYIDMKSLFTGKKRMGCHELLCDSLLTFCCCLSNSLFMCK